MEVIKFLMALWKKDGTKVIGYVNSVLTGVLSIALLYPEFPLFAKDKLPYLAIAALLFSGGTVRRGYTNTSSKTDP
jgi:hypothetical protein